MFSECRELRELQVTEIPGLGAKGEDTSTAAPQTTSESTEPVSEPQNQIIPEISTWTLWAQNAQIDYRQLNNPQQRKLITSEPKIADPSEQTNLAFEQLILEHSEFSFLAKEGPKTVDEVIMSEEGEQWKKAMEEEMENLKQMGTWTLQDLPDDQKAIGCKWVFIRKRDETGSIIQWKARLVAQGFSQKPGTDYDNNGTFAPMMWFKTLCTLLTHTTINKLHLR